MTETHLLTAELREQLLSNGRNAGEDHVPIVKLFNPAGPAAWLVSELYPDEDMMFGLADLGMGCPELGSFSLAELSSLELPFGLRIERDRSFRSDRPLSVWATAARSTGSIKAAEELFAAMRSSGAG